MRPRMIRTRAGILALLVAANGCANTRTGDVDHVGPQLVAAGHAASTVPTVPTGHRVARVPAAGPEDEPPPRLSGDWGGSRTSLEDQGLRLDANLWLTGQSVLGNTGFSSDDEIQIGGELLTTLDSEKLGLYAGGTLKVRVEGRAGDSVVGAAGTIAPVSAPAVLPPARFDQEILTVTEVTLGQEITEQFSIYGGLIQTFYQLDQNPFAAGRGIDQFMNMALVQSPVLFRGVPYSTLGAGVDILATEMIKAKVLIMDQRESVNRNPFSTDRGTTLVGEVALDYDFSGLPGGDMFGFVWSDSDYAPLDEDPRLIFPPGSAPQLDENTWALYYNFYQYISVLDESDPSRGWGIFGRFNLADKRVNPVQWMASFGLGGGGIFAARPDDRFGFGYYYLGMSDEVQVSALGVGDEQGVELYYDFAVMPYLRLTPDIQWVDVGQAGASNGWVVALRANLLL